MPSKRTFPLFALAFILFVSGCTTTTGGTGPGVVITAWEPELASIFSNDEIDFLLKVENQGQSRARNVVAEITNIDTTEWGSFFQQQLQLGDLLPADPVTGTPGETKSDQFENLRAPILSKGTSFTYQPTVRVSYDYTTTAQKPITIVDSQELIRIKQRGGTLPSSTSTQTSGPLNVQIIMGNFVKTSGTFGSFGQTYDIFPVQIRITNTLFSSGGSVIPKSFGGFGSFGADHPVLVRVTPPSGTSFIFSGFGDEDCSRSQLTIDLFRGQEAEITCELEVTNPPSFLSESQMQVELDYRYFIDAVTQVTVQGTREVGGGFF